MGGVRQLFALFPQKAAQQDIVALLDNNGNAVVKYKYNARCRTDFELAIQIEANSMGAFYFSSYIFVADAIINKFSLW